MKLQILTAILATTVVAVPASRAQAPGGRAQTQQAPAAHPALTIRGTIIALPNAEATQFSAKQDLNGKPAEALTALEKLVAQKKASSVANLAIIARSGERSAANSGKVSLEVEPVDSRDGKLADLTIAMDDNGHKIVTSFQTQSGGVKLLGSVQSPTDKGMTDYIFVRVSF